MSFICCVCHDPLTTNPDGDLGAHSGAAGGDGGEQVDIVVTKCGHLYHLVCLTRWFNRQANPRFVQECPYCHTSVGTNGYQRIFPAGDEGTDRELAARRTLIQTKVKELEELRQRHEEFQTMLAKCGHDLEDESLAHDMLKLDHAVRLSELDQLTDQLKAEEAIRKSLTAEKANLTIDKENLVADNTKLTHTLAETQAELDISKADLEEILASKLVLTATTQRLEEEVERLTNTITDNERLHFLANGEDKMSQTDTELSDAQYAKYEMCKDHLENAQTLLAQLFGEEVVSVNNNTISQLQLEKSTMDMPQDCARITELALESNDLHPNPLSSSSPSGLIRSVQDLSLSI